MAGYGYGGGEGGAVKRIVKQTTAVQISRTRTLNTDSVIVMRRLLQSYYRFVDRNK
jgi:hypothetical protein